MNDDAPDHATLSQAIEVLRREVASLSTRIAIIEHTAAQRLSLESESPAGAAAASDASCDADGPTPEILAVISAALAAYLGVKPHVRQISILGGGSWAQQGRVRIQASHALTVQRD